MCILKALTVLDVARIAGVSVATVSRVLSGVPTVTPENRERVLSVVNDVGFLPNRAAQTLRRGKGTTVAFLVSDIEQGTSAALAKHVQQALETDGRDLLLYNLNHDPERLLSFLRRAPMMGLCGIVISTTDKLPVEEMQPLLAMLTRIHVPIVSVLQQLQHVGIRSIVSEERDACSKSVGHLLKSGRSPVAFLGRIGGSAVGAERYQGYCDALKEAGEPLRRELVWDASYRYAGGYRALSRAIDSGLEFHGVQAASDELAFGAMSAIQDGGRRIPEDVAVIGFGDLELGAHTRPSLSSVSTNCKLLAEHVAAAFRNPKGMDDSGLTLIGRQLVLRRST